MIFQDPNQIRASTVLSGDFLRQECSNCRKERRLLQRRAIGQDRVKEAPTIVHDVLQTPGQPLGPTTLAFMEPRFGYDFSQVRVHTDSKSAESASAMNAKAYSVGQDIVFGAGKYAPSTNEGKRLLAHELTHSIQQPASLRQMPFESITTFQEDIAEKEAETVEKAILLDSLQQGNQSATVPLSGQFQKIMYHRSNYKSIIHRKKGEGKDASEANAPPVGIEGGESKTPSDQTKLADGYLEREDGNYDTPYKRVISKEQALAESLVLNSSGIFMAAYLARYNNLSKKYKLPVNELDNLSSDAGFMKQFKTGDIVLRMMSAEDSAGLAKITDSNYSHSGIVQVTNGRVFVLDSYPGRKSFNEGAGQDSTQLIRFEDFFSDHGTERIVRGIVLRSDSITEKVRNDINSLIDFYNFKQTTFDYEFKVDNGEYSLYCSELVWRILKEAGAPTLPPNEFDFTKGIVSDLIQTLEMVIAIQKSQETDTTRGESQLAQLRKFLGDFESATTKELYSPGSLERTQGLRSITGFDITGKIEGRFKVIINRGVVPKSSFEMPDPYVKLSSRLFGGGGKTSTKSDTTAPTWDEPIGELDYDSLRNVTLELYDEDVVFDDHLATFEADLRPVRPAGQTFELDASGAKLYVTTMGIMESFGGSTIGAFGPQAARKESQSRK